MFEKLGAIKIGVENSPYKQFMEKCSKLVNIAEEGAELFRDFFDEEDGDFVCCYKLETKNLR